MAAIRQDDFIQSVADAFQFISYYHPEDYIRDLAAAWRREESPAAKDAMAQILINSRMAAEGHRPICQDTGIVNVFLKWGQNCRLESDKSLQDVVDEGAAEVEDFLHGHGGWLLVQVLERARVRAASVRVSTVVRIEARR